MHPGFTHCFAATEQDTRTALAEIMDQLRRIGVTDEQAGGVEIALAEVVNNIVEHAYEGLKPDRIVLRAVVRRGKLRLLLVDHGGPLPDEELPEGKPADIEKATAELPEGGFGWFLIRTLTRDIRYRRSGNSNHLLLIFDLLPAVT